MVWKSDDDDLGYEVGHALGEYQTYSEAVAARDAGELDLWFEYNRPKTMEEWDAWEAQHGKKFWKRWKVRKDKS